VNLTTSSRKKRRLFEEGTMNDKLRILSQINRPERYICSWEGLEEQRMKIRDAAVEIRDSDAVLRALVPSVQATGHIGRAICDINTAATPEVARAGRAHLAMRELITEFRDQFRLDVSFIRCEVVPILDPSERTRQVCEQQLQATRKRNGYAT